MMSPHFKNLIADRALSGQMYLSAHAGDPGDQGGNEVQGGEYDRQPCGGESFDAAIGGIKATNKRIVFDEMPAATITHVGLWDSAIGGRFLLGAKLPAAIELAAGDALRCRPGKVGFAISEMK